MTVHDPIDIAVTFWEIIIGHTTKSLAYNDISISIKIITISGYSNANAHAQNHLIVLYETFVLCGEHSLLGIACT